MSLFYFWQGWASELAGQGLLCLSHTCTPVFFFFKWENKNRFLRYIFEIVTTLPHFQFLLL
jgi:hypothetical protein